MILSAVMFFLTYWITEFILNHPSGDGWVPIKFMGIVLYFLPVFALSIVMVIVFLVLDTNCCCNRSKSCKPRCCCGPNCYQFTSEFIDTTNEIKIRQCNDVFVTWTKNVHWVINKNRYVNIVDWLIIVGDWYYCYSLAVYELLENYFELSHKGILMNDRKFTTKVDRHKFHFIWIHLPFGLIEQYFIWKLIWISFIFKTKLFYHSMRQIYKKCNLWRIYN